MRFAHTTIHTARYQESVGFYREVAGLSVVDELPNGMITFLSDKEGDTCIEIIRNAGPEYKGEGISVGFFHPDPESYREELKEKGFEVTGLVRPDEKTVFFYVKDPNGLDVQFIYYRRDPAASRRRS
ncbi:MAG: VOC family protein [Candidatus Methanomethylophilaceae archaeon]|nr:VOC family protein [Candidatus Methanomethylophilaceae archaeon]